MSKPWTLSIDPASRNSGVSLWEGDVYKNSIAISSNLKTWSSRAAHMRVQLRDFVIETLPKGETITRAVIESIPKIVEPSVQLIAGALLADPMYNLDITRKYFVSVSTWKAYCRREGAIKKDPKGVSALTEIGWDMKNRPVTSDDVADSILIYLAWLEKHGTK